MVKSEKLEIYDEKIVREKCILGAVATQIPSGGAKQGLIGTKLVSAGGFACDDDQDFGCDGQWCIATDHASGSTTTMLLVRRLFGIDPKVKANAI